MADYSFYTEQFRGNSIPETDFPRVMARATDQLAQYKRCFTVSAPSADAEDMALCAMADAVYYYEMAAGGIPASVSIGSVSTSYAQGSLPDISPKAQAAELLRCARMFLHIERWRGRC